MGVHIDGRAVLYDVPVHLVKCVVAFRPLHQFIIGFILNAENIRDCDLRRLDHHASLDAVMLLEGADEAADEISVPDTV